MAHFLQPENKDSGQYKISVKSFCNSCIVIKTDAINKQFSYLDYNKLALALLNDFQKCITGHILESRDKRSSGTEMKP